LPRPRDANGAWFRPFDPNSRDGFVEGNAYQYLWFVPHDARGLVNWLGGDDVAVQLLDEHFSNTNAGADSKYFYIGNEPSFHTPWLYNSTNKPSRTQAQVRRIMEESFHSGVEGLPGNDDLGATSSWYVWSALGLFPAVPGENRLTLASPLFTKTTIHLPAGRTLTLNAPGAPSVYIQSINGGAVSEPWLPEGMVFRGGELNFTLGDQPNDGAFRASAPAGSLRIFSSSCL
jgi:predicted alpha-1,2-mannosidase